MLKILAASTLVVMMTACGQVDRVAAGITGSSISCVDGVQHIQFTSGASVKYNQDGSVATCK